MGRGWAVALLIAFGGTELVAQPTAAYEATVTGENVFAFSGPGVGYYPTSSLLPGTKVRIVGERTQYWTPIDPPKGSFSWIPARTVEEQPDGSGVVTVDNTQVRVGSELSDARHVFQVALNRGDKVALLDHVFFKTGSNTEAWYKILPPADEVRYVATKDLDLPGVPSRSPILDPLAAPSLPAAGSTSPALATVGQSSGAGATAPVNAQPGRMGVAGPTVGNRVIGPAIPISFTRSSPNASSTGATTSVSDRPSGLGERMVDLPDGLDAPPTRLQDDPRWSPAERLANLQTQMRLMRAQLPDRWQVDQARAIAEDILKQADPDTRTRTLAVLDELGQWKELSETYSRFRRRQELVRTQDAELATLARRRQEQLGGVTRGFTAEGTLTQAVLRVDDQPTFLLRDRSGKDRFFVVPVPGLRMERYVGTFVGLVGRAETRPNLPIPVLRTEQLTPLEQVQPGRSVPSANENPSP